MGFSGYNWRYLLTHPWIILRECWRQLRWAWQRVFRGWDDRVTWDIAAYLSDKMPLWIRKLRDDGFGYPGKPDGGTETEWPITLTKIAEGFAAFNEADDMPFEKGWTAEQYVQSIQPLLDKQKEGMELFAKWYVHLWS